MESTLSRILMAITLMALVGCATSPSPTPMPQEQQLPTTATTTVVLMQPPGVQTVERSWTADELLARSATEGAPVWADDDELTFFYQGEADEVRICCGIQSPMRRIEGTDLWVLTVRVRDLSQAVIGYAFMPYQDGHPVASEDFMDRMQVWRGPEAPPALQRAETLRGQIKEHVIDSESLGEPRGLTVYLPPGHDPTRRLPVVYAADGESVSWLATVLDPLIADGSVPAVIVVGVHSGGANQTLTEPHDPSQDRRAQEYLLGFNRERFEAHERFFIYEVADWAEQNLGVAANREQRAVFGYSNGGAFAVAMGARHPERYGHVIAFSLGRGPAGLGAPAWTADMAPRHYLVAGTLEPFLEPTSKWAAKLDRLGVEHVYRQRVCGHDVTMWEEEFPGAVAWAFVDR
ncbi:MAG: hypothetical protein IMY86_13170 [Chloroflexi bacterium]|nr:hypothetical protein [Chloroflexota bacterium]